VRPVSRNKIDIKWRYFSFVKINRKHTLAPSADECQREAHTVGDPDKESAFSNVSADDFSPQNY